MEPIYRLLGIAASIGNSTSRFRINFIPFNWIIMGLLVAGLGWTLSVIPDAVNNGIHPRKVAVGDLVKDPGNPRTYVTVSGLFSPTDGFRSGTTDEDGHNKTIDTYYAVLFDKATMKGILVKSDTNFSGADITPKSFTGLVQAAEEDVKSELAGGGNKFGPVTVDPSYVLSIEDSPGNPTGLFALFIIFLAALSAMVITFLSRYVVFRRVGPVLSQESLAAQLAGGDQGPQFPDNIRVTGPLMFEGSGSKRFLDMYTAPVYLETGELAFFARINASSTFFGVTTKKRDGFWALSLRDGLAWNINKGFMYCGAGRRAAIRFAFTDLGTQKTDTAVLSFANVADRDTMLRTLALYGKYEAPAPPAPVAQSGPVESLPPAPA